MKKKPDWGEPMPFRVFDFTPEQEALIRRIEEITQAEVIIIAPSPRTMSSYDRYEGFLSRPEEYLNELESEDFDNRWYTPWAEENGELSYIRDQPITGAMTEEELQRYPENIRGDMEIEFELSDTGSCNIVSTECSGFLCNDIDHILQKLLALTVLLKMGWHLGRERDFDDPFIPEPEPLSEDEQIWQEYCESRDFEREEKENRQPAECRSAEPSRPPRF